MDRLLVHWSAVEPFSTEATFRIRETLLEQPTD